MDKNSNELKLLKSQMAHLSSEVKSETVISYEKCKDYLDSLNTISKIKGVDGLLLNEGAEVLKTVLSKSEDFRLLRICIYYLDNRGFIFRKLIENFVSNKVVLCIEDRTNLRRLLEICPQNKDDVLITLIKKVLKEYQPETCEEFSKRLSDFFQKSDNNLVVVMAFRLMIGLGIELPIESNPDAILRFLNYISLMRLEKNPEWSTNLIQLIKGCGINLHQKRDILKLILETLEPVFRHPNNVNERLDGFECWKALIDNFGLDINFLSNKRQLKLLLTPLRANLSRQNEVIVKRFNVFVHLLETLQEHAIKCLEDFLEFVFGCCVDENKDPTKCGLGKTVKTLWKPIIDVFEAILNKNNNNFKLKQIVNQHNIMLTYKIVINSMFEACNIIHHEEFVFGNNRNDPLIKHLWKLLFDIILLQENKEDINTCLEYIFEMATDKNYDFVYTLWCCFADILSDYDLHNFNFFLKILPKVFGHQVEKIKSVRLLNKVLNFLRQNMKNNEERLYKALEWFFTSSDMYKMVFLWNFWMNIALCLIDKQNLNDDDYFNFINYPILHFNEQTERKIVQDVSKLWIILFLPTNDTNKTRILQELIKIEDKYILKCFIKEMAVSKDRHLTSTHAGFILKIIENFLIEDTNIEYINILVYFLTNDYKNVYTYFIDIENLKTLCNCVKYTIENGKRFNILNALFVILTKIRHNDVIEKFAEHLQFLYDMYKSDKNLSETTKKLILDILKILKFETGSKKLTKNDFKVQFLSPPNSQSNLTRTKKIIEKVKNVPVDEESASKFVLIDTQVHFDKNNLNEHQKEIMGRRREDIPALYEDLTQSQSGFDEEEKNKQLKTERELKRLQMNIVGAMDYTNSKRKRKSKIDFSTLLTETEPEEDSKTQNQVEDIQKRQTRRKSMDFGLLSTNSEQLEELVENKRENVGRRRRRKKSLDCVSLPTSEDIIESTQKTVEKSPLTEIELNEIDINPPDPVLPQTTESNLNNSTLDTQLDVPKEPELNELPQIESHSEAISIMEEEKAIQNDTEVEELLQNTPNTPISKCNLPSSPITGDTPTRTDELLNNTLNISPIQTENSPEKQNVESPKKDLLKRGRNERSTRLLSLVNVNFKRFNSLKPLPVTMSPSIGNIRMKKLFTNGQLTKTKQDVETDDILTFSRDVPSPLEVPKSSILKRKHSELADDSQSPCAKRKRVNFSDPILTSKKLIIKDDNEFSKDTDPMGFDELFVENTEVIYPELCDCEENVSIILKNIEPNVKNVLETKNITTVGDLANLTKTQLSEIPFKDSINVLSLLEKYHKSLKDDNIEVVTEMIDSNEEEKQDEEIFNKIKSSIESDLKSLPTENRIKLYSNLLDFINSDLPTEETFNLHLNCLKSIHNKAVNKG